jgi:hypothetical protein
MNMEPCPKCGAPNSVKREGCFNCGTVLREVTLPEPPPPVQSMTVWERLSSAASTAYISYAKRPKQTSAAMSTLQAANAGLAAGCTAGMAFVLTGIAASIIVPILLLGLLLRGCSDAISQTNTEMASKAQPDVVMPTPVAPEPLVQYEPPPAPALSTLPPVPISQTSTTPPPAVQKTKTLGEEGRLDAGVNGDVPAFSSQDAMNKFWQAITRKDVYGIVDLMADKRMVQVPTGTRVLVIDGGGFLMSDRKVRILEGDYTGQAAWVPVEWVK